MDETITEMESPHIQNILSEIKHIINSRLCKIECGQDEYNLDTNNVLKGLPIVKGLEIRLDTALSEIKRLEGIVGSLKVPQQSNITLQCSEIDSGDNCVTHDEITDLVGEEVNKIRVSRMSDIRHLVGGRDL